MTGWNRAARRRTRAVSLGQMSYVPSAPDRRTTTETDVIPPPKRFAVVRRFLAQFDERPLLQALGATEREQVVEQLRRDSATRVARLGWAAFVFFALLVQVDLLRLESGDFGRSPVYLLLFATHLLVGLSGIPAVMLAVRRRRDAADWPWRLHELHIGLIVSGLLAMGLLGLAYRDTSYELSLAFIVMNLVYQLPPTTRRAVNLGVLAASLGIVWSHPPATEVEHFIRFNEVLIIALLTALAAGGVLRERVRSILNERRLAALTLVDTLTAVASRRRVEDVLRDELAAQGQGRPVSLIIVDVDHFKQVNDLHGHNTGDEVLRAIARILQREVRALDLVGRWGGEEFVVVCPDTGLEGAVGLAERLRAKIARQDFGRIGQKTASFGVAEAHVGESALALVERADRALYAAKRGGRDRVETAKPELTSEFALELS